MMHDARCGQGGGLTNRPAHAVSAGQTQRGVRAVLRRLSLPAHSVPSSMPPRSSLRRTTQSWLCHCTEQTSECPAARRMCLSLHEGICSLSVMHCMRAHALFL